MYTSFSDDGCPNNCGYCKKHGYECIYLYKDNGEIVYNHNSSLLNTNCKCSKCGKELMQSETYTYKDYYFCDKCFDKGKKEVEETIEKANDCANKRKFEFGDPEVIPFKEQEKITAFKIAQNESIYDKKLRDRKLL